MIWYSEFVIEGKPSGAKRFTDIKARASTIGECYKKLYILQSEFPGWDFRFKDINTNFVSKIFIGGKK